MMYIINAYDENGNDLSALTISESEITEEMVYGYHTWDFSVFQAYYARQTGITPYGVNVTVNRLASELSDLDNESAYCDAVY